MQYQGLCSAALCKQRPYALQRSYELGSTSGNVWHEGGSQLQEWRSARAYRAFHFFESFE